jgi:predicted ATPase with chaperone activity
LIENYTGGRSCDCVYRLRDAPLLCEAAERFAVTGRSIDRVLKMTRTTAELEGAAKVQDHRLAEVLRCRGWEAMPNQ